MEKNIEMEQKSYLIDMDGVLISGNTLIPGADEFIESLLKNKIKHLVLTNNSIFTPGDLAHRLQIIGINITKDRIFTSAMATARFMQSQKPNGKAFVIGESGLTEAIHEAGYIVTETDPDYVVLGETFNYNFDMITKAVRLILDGAHFIATNPDPTGPSEAGVVPACGAMAALIEKACGKTPFFIGKPNPYMMRSALNYLGVHSEKTVMVGDRMDTDVIAGIESGMETILVLSGMISDRYQINNFPFQPSRIEKSVKHIKVN